MATTSVAGTLRSLLLPALHPQSFQPIARPISSPILASSLLRLSLPTILTGLSGITGVLQDLWDSVLRAAPKKKTTHSKARSRRLAGKALKDLTNINRCSGCGRPKLMHTLCPYCVSNIKDMWAGRTMVFQDKKTDPSQVYHNALKSVQAKAAADKLGDELSDGTLGADKTSTASSQGQSTTNA